MMVTRASDGKEVKIWATYEEAQARYDICKTCSYFNHEDFRCGLCGCPMKRQVKHAAMECPAKKWGKLI